MSNIDPFINVHTFLEGETITVQYQVSPEFAGKAPYKFELLAYEDLSFNSPIYSIPSTQYYVVDDKRVRQSNYTSYVYKLKLTTADNVVYVSRWFGWQPSDNTTRHKYLLASDICRREHIRFNYAGLYGYLLKRKTYSAAATNDVDPVTGEPLVDNSSSYGVGQAGGYYDPVLVRFSIEAYKVNTDYAPDGRGSQSTELVTVRSAGFPYIEQHDVLVMQDGTRYTVIDAQVVYFPGSTIIILQTPSLRLVPMTDTIYNINIPSFPTDE